VFHSEADFQHALAWEMHSLDPGSRIRLELRLPEWDPREYLDVWAIWRGCEVAVELKYKVRKVTVTHDEERFDLRSHAAENENRYRFLKDLQRLERFVARTPSAVGYAIFLTNNPGYWTGPRDSTAADWAFRLREGELLTGALRWRAGTAKKRGLAEALTLSGKYHLRWREFSSFPQRSGRFRYLLLKVQTASDQ